MALPHIHDDIRWPDGRRIVTKPMLGNLGWSWWIEASEMDEPNGAWFATEADALEDARQAIEEQDDCPHPPEARITLGVRSLAAPLGRESDPTYCDLCGERVDD